SRIDRKWHSKKEQGIWLSMILRPNILPYLAPQLTLLTATVLANVIDQQSDVTPQIKWPNDILINGKKMAGILTEMQAEQDQVLYVIIGIGMNMNQTKEDLPPDLSERATSLQIETNQKWDMLPILQNILQTLEEKYSNFIDEGFDPVKVDWENYGFRMNERLQITSGNRSWEGRFLGIAEDGALLAENEVGETEKVYSA